MKWTADFVNNPNADFDLCVDIMEDETYRGNIFCDNDGIIKITIYPSHSGSFTIPANWLAELLQEAMRDLQKNRSDP